MKAFHGHGAGHDGSFDTDTDSRQADSAAQAQRRSRISLLGLWRACPAGAEAMAPALQGGKGRRLQCSVLRSFLRLTEFEFRLFYI